MVESLVAVCFVVVAVGCVAPSSSTDAGANTVEPVVDPPTAGSLIESPVGTVDGDQVQALVGPDGGSLTSDDGRVTVTVPPGALAAPTTLSVQRITSTAPGAIGGAARLTKPDNVTFALPVTVSFVLLPNEVSGVDIDSLGAGFQNFGGRWEKSPASWNAETRTLSVSTSHFSDWSALAGRQIRPGTASVQTNKSVTLQVEWCEEVTADQRPACKVGGTEVCMVAQCRKSSLPGSVFMNWAVNGVAGGSAKTGTIAGSGSSAVFSAPATVPNPAVVVASVRSGPTSTLVSNLTITDKAEYTGDFYFFGLQGGTYSGDGHLVFREIENLPDVARYEVVSGTFTVTARFPDCDPVNFVKVPAGVGEREGALVVSKGTKLHFWNAGSTLLEVPTMCGTPRTSMNVPISVALSVNDHPFKDITDLNGKRRGLPLGGGVAWYFTKVAP